MTMTSQFADMTLSPNFWRLFAFLVEFSYWSMFHVNIIIGSGVLTILIHKGLTRNQEIGNTPVWVLPNTWRLGWVRDSKLGTNVSYEMLLNAAKCQGSSFCRFWVNWKQHRMMSKQLSIFSLLQPKPKSLWIIAEENSGEKLKNDVRSCLTRLVHTFQKKWKRNKKITLQKNRKSETEYCMRREKIEAWSKDDDAFKFRVTADRKLVTDKTKRNAWLEISESQKLFTYWICQKFPSV